MSDLQSRLPEVLAYLREQNLQGRLNEFTDSLLSQAEKNGRLSDKQIACVVKDLDRPKSKTPDVPSPEILPAGRYAIESEEGELRFYRLWRGTRNPNYVALHVQHGPNESEIPFKATASILKKIVAADPATCAVRYGHEIGSCSQCGLRLTNRVSRALGIGPVCGGRFWSDDWKQIVRNAREEIVNAGFDPDADVEEGEEVVRYDIPADLAHRDEQMEEFDAAVEDEGEDEVIVLNHAVVLDDMTNPEIESVIAYAKRILEKRAFAAREREQENAAYEAKMARDRTFLSR